MILAFLAGFIIGGLIGTIAMAIVSIARNPELDDDPY
jgi:hypothetical protein